MTDKETRERRRVFEVLIDDPTIADLSNMAVCTTKGSRGKLSFCCGNEDGQRSRTEGYLNILYNQEKLNILII